MPSHTKHTRMTYTHTQIHAHAHHPPLTHTAAHPAQYDVDFHSQQQSVEQGQESCDTVAELSQADAVLRVLGELDGFHQKGQDPVEQQSFREDQRGTLEHVWNHKEIPTQSDHGSNFKSSPDKCKWLGMSYTFLTDDADIQSKSKELCFW